MCTLHYVTRNQRTAKALPPQRATITQWDRSHLASARTSPAPAQKLKGDITKVEKLWEAAWTMFSEVFPSRNMGRLNHNAPFFFCSSVKAEACQLSQRTSALHLQTCDSPGGGNISITVWCLLGFLFAFVYLVGWVFTGDKGWVAFVPLTRCNLVDMESYTAGKSWMGRLVNVSH